MQLSDQLYSAPIAKLQARSGVRNPRVTGTEFRPKTGPKHCELTCLSGPNGVAKADQCF